MPNIIRQPIISGDLEVAGNSNLTGNTNVSGVLNVAGKLNASTESNLNGDTNITGNLHIYDLDSFNIFSDIDMNGYKIKNIGTATDSNHIVTKDVLDSTVNTLLSSIGSTGPISGKLSNISEIEFTNGEVFNGTENINKNIELIKAQLNNIQSNLDILLLVYGNDITYPENPPTIVNEIFTYNTPFDLSKNEIQSINFGTSLGLLYSVKIEYDTLTEPTVFKFTETNTDYEFTMFGNTNSNNTLIYLKDEEEVSNIDITSLFSDVKINSIKFYYQTK